LPAGKLDACNRAASTFKDIRFEKADIPLTTPTQDSEDGEEQESFVGRRGRRARARARARAKKKKKKHKQKNKKEKKAINAREEHRETRYISVFVPNTQIKKQNIGWAAGRVPKPLTPLELHLNPN